MATSHPQAASHLTCVARNANMHTVPALCLETRRNDPLFRARMTAICGEVVKQHIGVCRGYLGHS